MFRRIELINVFSGGESHKSGIMGRCHRQVCDAWADELPAPQITTNCRFYFTEAGWNRFGRKVIAACGRTSQRYRVVAVKERSVDVVFRDTWQVAVRPRRQFGHKDCTRLG